MEKKRLAYVDYWSHQYTRSGDFLREMLSEEFEITDFWWKPNEKIPLDEINKFENIFPKLLNKSFNFAAWSSDKNIFKILENGLFDPQGIDSDIDSNLYVEA